MGTQEDARRLACLTTLGHRLPSATTTEDAFEHAVRAVSELGLGAGICLIDGDMSEMVALQLPDRKLTSVTPSMASRLLGVKVPIDGVESVRVPVRLRRPYAGPPRVLETLRSVTDQRLGRELPSSIEDMECVTVPVTASDRVVAVLIAWSDAVTLELVPTLEAVAAMLAALWVRPAETGSQRFNSDAPRRINGQARTALTSLLEAGGMVAAVQPIVRLYDSSVIGFEALTRFPPSSHFVTPDDLFSAASALHMESQVDIACIRAALREAASLGEADLFINVLIRTLLDRHGMRALHEAVRGAGVDPGTIVLEFSERDPVPDLARLQRIAAELRANGFRIAVDDAGSGHASMRVIAELRPEFIKVDRSLINAIDTDRARRALVVSLLSFSGHIGARLIAEGVETASQNETLQSLGVQFGQGWQLGRPVLLQPVEGHGRIEVVDAAWFAARRISRVRSTTHVESQQSVPEIAIASDRSSRRSLARALSDAALALQMEHDPLRILEVMAEQMTHVVPVREMAIFAADYETHQFVPLLATGPDREQILADSFSLDAGLTGWAFAQGTPQNIADTATHPSARQVPNTAVVHESLLLIPLIAGERKLGIINCWRVGTGQFSNRELEAAALFAHVAATAWRNAQLYTELLSAAMTDPLTGLYNSRWLRDTMERDLTRCQRDGTSLALLLIDLDHFKTVNDTAGHAAGDMVLQRVAGRLRATVRGADAVVRLGGEEFVVLLHGCDTESAGSVADVVRQTIRETTMPEGCGLQRITASIGIAVYPHHGTTLDQLLATADRAMYEAKHAGRDRVQVGMTRRTNSIVPLTSHQRTRRAG